MKNKQQLTKAQIIAKFEEFLKENNCYEDFVKNYNEDEYNKNLYDSLQEYFDDMSEYVYIEEAFIWDDGFKECYDFWGLINNKWQSRYKEIIGEEN